MSIYDVDCGCDAGGYDDCDDGSFAWIMTAYCMSFRELYDKNSGDYFLSAWQSDFVHRYC